MLWKCHSIEKKRLGRYKSDHYLFCIKAVERKILSENSCALIKQFTGIKSLYIDEYYKEKASYHCFAITGINSFFPLLLSYRQYTDILVIQKKMNFARLLQNKGCNPMVSVLTLITDGLSQKTGFYLCEPSSGTELLHRVCIWILWQLNWETVNWVLH